MLTLYLYRIVSIFWALAIFFLRKIKEDDYNNSASAKKFLAYNNKNTLTRLKGKKITAKEILVLLPHCLQEYDCPIKITSNIENCKKCGKCDIKTIVTLKHEYGIHVNVATGGTLARKYVKEARPRVIIAVACERDLISGIIDSFPLPVYGIFNKRIHGPCYNTLVGTEEIRTILTVLLEDKDPLKKRGVSSPLRMT